ncbi:MAG: hypothetical protein GF372_10985, partial [Candidatus Marinimicrobia bacterium]|nr:hypothetical protein [Candidatus Neomarinimicrobiota bacterium]
GTVEQNPAQDLYEEGTEVQLIATPDAGWEFLYWFWNNDAMSSNDTTTITVTQDTTVQAVFQEATYFIYTTVDGQGSVSRNPAKEGYSYNTEVELTAIPSLGWTFDNWSGDLTGTQNPATIVMDSDKNITTNFFELPDGTHWEGYSKSQWTERSNHANESFNNRLYVFGGYNYNSTDGSTYYNDVWTTTDGLNWDEETYNNPAPWSGRRSMATVVHDNALWIIGGNTSDNSRENYGSVSDVWNTTDGSNWVQVADSTSEFPGMDSHAAVSFNERIYITGGFNPSNESTNSVAYSSSDGVNWTTEGETPPRYGHASVVFKGKIWILGGNDGSGNYSNEIYSSPDGKSWELVTPSTGIWTAREDLTAIVFGGRIWVMGGNTDTGYMNDIWYSSDGVSWTKVTINLDSPLWGPRGKHASAVFNNKVWITGGINPDFVYMNDTWKTIKP